MVSGSGRGSFTHLHVHTEYSMLDGAARIGETVAAAVADGQPALGITDHGNMYGILEFYKACRNQGIKPILGTEAYMAHESRFERPARRGRVDDTGGDTEGGKKLYYHLTLLAETDEGYKNLIQLASRAFLEGYFYKPRVDWEVLSAHAGGLIATTGCLGGHVLQSLLQGDIDGATTKAGRLQDIFGKDNLFVELQDHGIPEQHKTNPQLIEIARRIGAPLLATNDSHYVHQRDAVAHDALLCVQTGSLMSDPNRFKFHGDQHYLKSAAEMRSLFGEVPQACDNTLWIAERADVEIAFGKPQLPNFPLPEGFESDGDYLRHLTFEGARERWGDPLPDDVVERLAYELQVIGDMGFSSYFLIVWDLIAHARRNGIRVGPGRGSAAGCAVAYCLRITDLDPIRYDLLFERFLNPSRISMPDIDMDFDSRYRDEMIRYAAERYGRDHVAQIVTFSTIKARAAVRDAARVLGQPYAIGDRVAKAMPPLVMGRDTPLYACLDQHPRYEDGYKMAAELRQMYEDDADVRQVVDVAKGLEGLRRQDGIHAAAVVITKEPLTEHLPIQRKPENGQALEDAPIVTQYEMHGVEELGLLKMDFLGLRNLDVITDTVEVIRRTRGIELDIDNVPLDDVPTFELLRRGDSVGVFQLEGVQMRALMRSLAPTTFEDVAALVALYRPGPMAANMHNDYADRKNGRKPVEYLHPDAEDVLGDTYGLCLTGDTMVHEALTGRPTRLDEIRPGEGFWVQAVDDDLRPVVRPVTAWVDQGDRETYRLRLVNGMELTGTADHPVLTEGGWRRLGDLRPDDHVAVPHELVAPSIVGSMRRSRLRVLAYLLADGALSVRSAVAFVNSNEAILDEFAACVADSFPDTKISRNVGLRGVVRLTVGNGKGNGGGPSSLLHWLRELGLKAPAGSRSGGPRSASKWVPMEVFSLTNDDIGWFLASLWDCDGYVGERLAHYRTISRTLARDVQALLHRLGFDAPIYRAPYTNPDGSQNLAYQVTVYDGARFAALIAPYIAHERKREAVFAAVPRGGTLDRAMVVDEVKTEWTGTTREFADKVGIPRWHLSPYARTKHPRIHNEPVQKLVDTLELPRLRRAMNVRWVRVDSVVPAGVRRVYDITVDDVHNFVANGMVVHNCIYQESVMRIAQKFAGYSLADADNLRKACLPRGTRVLTKSRGYVPIEEVMHLSDRRVQTIDTVSCTSRYELVDDVWSVGVKPVYRLTTSTGYTIEATDNHPFLVEGEWRELRDLHPGDLVGVASRTTTDGGSRVTTPEVELAALLISEGYTPDVRRDPRRAGHFTNTDPELLATFRRAYEAHFGYAHRRRSRAGSVTQLRLAPDDLLALAPVLGTLGPADDKEIPNRFINAPRHQVERFLGLYFCAGGWADRSGVHFGSKSKRVCLALKRMLLRCGIISNLRSRRIAGHGTRWTLSVADKGQAKAFARLVGPHLSEAKAAKVARWLTEWADGASATSIGIPSSFLATELLRRRRVTGRTARQLGVDSGGYLKSPIVHRDTLSRLLYSERLEDLRTGDLIWDTVTSVEYVGESECFDFQMENPDRPYAVVEDFLVHNCGKKDRKLIATERERFVAGCAATGYGPELGTKWFDIIEPFADYAFNRSHAFGYGFVAYQTAYLKANYPAEYLAALLTSVKANLEKAAVYLAECRAMGIDVVVPDINRSVADFTPVVGEDGGKASIIFGLSAVRNVGEGLVAHIVAEREANGPYADFYDFCRRVDTSVLNKRTIESLIKAGAFDGVGHPRKGLLAVFEQIVDHTLARRRERDMGIMTLFGDADDAGADGWGDFERTAIPDLEFDKRDRLAFEKEMLGLYVSDHPLLGAEAALARRSDCALDELAELEDGAQKAVGGVVTGLQRKWTRRGDLMAVFTLEDLRAAVEVMVFPRTMTEHGHKLADDAVVIVQGRVDTRDDAPKLIAQAIDVVEIAASQVEPLRLRVPPQLLSEANVAHLKRLLSDHPGDAPVFVQLGERQVVRLPERWNVDASNGLMGQLREALGPAAIVT